MKLKKNHLWILLLIILFAGLLAYHFFPFNQPGTSQDDKAQAIGDSLRQTEIKRQEVSMLLELEKEKWNRYESIYNAHSHSLLLHGRSSADSAELRRFADKVWDSLQARTGRQSLEVREDKNNTLPIKDRP